MTEKKKRDITPFEQELKVATEKVKAYKQICEANIVSLLYKNYELIYSYTNLKDSDFSINMWKVYFHIVFDIVIKEKKTLDEITVNFYLEKHPKLRDKYEEYGGWQKIKDTGEYVKEENLEGYVHELQKWNVVLQLLSKKFPVQSRISEFADMDVSQIYDEYTALLNHIFVNAETDQKSYNLSYNIEETIEELDKGLAVGMPYHNMPIYSKETGGMYLGGIHLLGGISNVGKSTYLRNCIIPSSLEYGEPIVIMLNEDGLKKWQREMLVWVANNIYKEDLQKYTVRDGKYTDEAKRLLYKCANWIKAQEEDNKIIIIPLLKWKTSYACKILNKYASLGVKHFIIDTFKADHDATSDNNWFIGQQNMVMINDIVKPESKNLSIVITFQMDKGSSKQRYFTQSNIGVFKNIVDVASTASMVRAIFEDEYEGGKHELKVFRSEGKNGKTKIPVKLDKNKKYHVMFIVKSREGAANDYQIVYEVDLSRNIIKEIGTTVVSVDF